MASTESCSYSSNNNSASELVRFPYTFQSITRTLTLLYGALFSFSLNFIVHSVELYKSLPSPQKQVHLAWAFVGIVTGLNQIASGYLLGSNTDKSWKKRKKLIFGMWIFQVLTTLIIYAHFFMYQQEMHCFYHGLYTFIATFTEFCEYTYFKRRAESTGKRWGLTYLCCVYHGD